MSSVDILNHCFFQDGHPSMEEHAEDHAAAEHADHGEINHVHSHMTKDHANEMITGVENGIPVGTHKPKRE